MANNKGMYDDLIDENEQHEKMLEEENYDQTFVAGDGATTSDDKVTLVTKEGLAQLKKELDYLKNTKRKEVAERIKEAISYGDLSENSEYEEAKNEQAFVEGRILELEQQVKNAKIITEAHQAKNKTIQLGSTVHLKNLSKGKDDVEVYTIVGSTEADPFTGKISNESPIGNSLLDKEKGEIVKVMIPAGNVEYQIVKID